MWEDFCGETVKQRDDAPSFQRRFIKPFFGFYALLGATALSLVATPASAQDAFVIDGTVGTTNGGPIIDGDDAITVSESGGVVFDAGQVGTSALLGDGDGNSLTNNGLIWITNGGGSVWGLFTQGDNNALTNSGDIILEGTGRITLLTGMEATLGDSSQILNLGRIHLTSNQRGIGINANDASTIRNFGEIDINSTGTVNDEAIGINVQDGNIVENYSDITIRNVDLFAEGITGRNNNLITNFGNISVDAKNASQGIAVNNNNTIINSGRIEVRGKTLNWGVYIDGNDNKFINEGGIISQIGAITGRAILVNGRRNVIDLRRGTELVGNLYFTNPDNTLIIGPGVNSAITIDTEPRTHDGQGLDVGFVPNSIIASGDAVLLPDGVLIAIDPTSFSAANQEQAILGRQIVDAVEQGGGPTDFVETADASQGESAFTWNTGGGGANALWGKTFFHYANADVTADRGAYDTQLTGLIFGYDSQMLGGDVYIGGALGEQDGQGSFDADSWHVFAGYQTGAALGPVDVSGGLTVGFSQFDQDRAFTDATGKTTLSADYASVFVMPVIAISTDLDPAEDAQLRPSVRLRAAAIFNEGYEESGGAYALDVDDRQNRVYELRAQAARILHWGRLSGFGPLDGAAMTASLRLGADIQRIDSDDVEGTVAGQPLGFSLDEDDTVRTFVGADLTLARSNGVQLNAGVELGRSREDVADISAQLRAKLPF